MSPTGVPLLAPGRKSGLAYHLPRGRRRRGRSAQSHTLQPPHSVARSTMRLSSRDETPARRSGVQSRIFRGSRQVALPRFLPYTAGNVHGRNGTCFQGISLVPVIQRCPRMCPISPSHGGNTGSNPVRDAMPKRNWAPLAGGRPGLALALPEAVWGRAHGSRHLRRLRPPRRGAHKPFGTPDRHSPEFGEARRPTA
jgi:hypothetical protein